MYWFEIGFYRLIYIPNHCAYVSPNNKLIDDFSIEFSTPHDKQGFARSIFKEKLPRVKKLNYNIAILDSAGSFNYFHWLLNILPKVDFLKIVISKLTTILLINNINFK